MNVDRTALRTPVRVALAVLLAVAAASCSWNQPAARVGDTEISRDQLEADTDALRTIPELATLLGAAVPEEGPVPATVVTSLLSLRISHAVLGARYEATKPLSAEDEAKELAAIDEQLTADLGSPDVYAKIPVSLREVLRTFLLYRTALLGEVPEDQILTEVSAIFEGADIEVDKRYGTWDPALFEVVPPEAPGQGPASSGDRDAS